MIAKALKTKNNDGFFFARPYLRRSKAAVDNILTKYKYYNSKAWPQ